MKRRGFLALGGALVVPRAVGATGGADVSDSVAAFSVRVLLASGEFEAPRVVDAWHFAWGDRTYRGTFGTVALPEGRPGLVNVLPLDAYLAGVLGKEISASWTPASQQAQAIVARTYALGRLRPQKPYDVVASESDQRYDGIAGETVEGRGAVDATSGLVVTYAGAPARVAYGACCGGRTADAADVWKTPYPYLRSIVDPNCAGAPNYAWQVDVAGDVVRDALRVDLDGIGDVRAAERDAAAPDERPRAIRFVGSTATATVTPSRLRAALGTGRVRSTFVRDVAWRDGTTLVLGGTGHGHGVGLCQWGARVLGERGNSAAEIVAFYLPGTALARV